MNEQPRQTISYLQALLGERRIRPKNKLGQNFLVDLNLLDVLLKAAEVSATDLAWEVGTGTGSLTARLAELAGAVVSVEIDPAFHQMARELLPERPNLRLILRDVLKGKNELASEVLATLDELATQFNCTQRKLIANLPYAVATPVIGNILVSGLPIDRLVVTVQWEIAERLMAPVGSSVYSSLAVFVQSVAEVELVRKLPPTVFWPRPLVDSAIVLIKPNASKRSLVGDVPRFRVFLRNLYVHRRKNLRGALAGWPTGRREKSDVDGKLAELGIPGSIRAEDLDIAQHLRLCAVFG
jgi:16S rRNA (adenine1518-N6/adenine1519-N6)-dimethyltransferase